MRSHKVGQAIDGARSCPDVTQILDLDGCHVVQRAGPLRMDLLVSGTAQSAFGKPIDWRVYRLVVVGGDHYPYHGGLEATNLQSQRMYSAVLLLI